MKCWDRSKRQLLSNGLWLKLRLRYINGMYILFQLSNVSSAVDSVFKDYRLFTVHLCLWSICCSSNPPCVLIYLHSIEHPISCMNRTLITHPIGHTWIPEYLYFVGPWMQAGKRLIFSKAHWDGQVITSVVFCAVKTHPHHYINGGLA